MLISSPEDQWEAFDRTLEAMERQDALGASSHPGISLTPEMATATHQLSPSPTESSFHPSDYHPTLFLSTPPQHGRVSPFGALTHQAPLPESFASGPGWGSAAISEASLNDDPAT